MIDKYEEKLNAEILKLKAETKQINSKWYKKLNYDIILKVLILAGSVVSIVFLTNLYDIKNERLKLERAELKRDISEFTLDKDSLYNYIVLLSNFSDSLKISMSQLSDSVIRQKNNYNYIAKKLAKKEDKIAFLSNELSKTNRTLNSISLQKKLADLIKIEADAGPDVSICAGDAIVLKASGGKKYLWSTGETTNEITVSPENTTTYSVMVYDGKSSDTDSVTVTINEVTSISLGDDISICAGPTITLTADSKSTFKIGKNN